MAKINTLFWDIGGVLLTDAWDRTQRLRALNEFELDEVEFNDRHEMVVSSFERGKITLDEYLQKIVFYRSRPFTLEAFREYIFSLSQAKPDSLEFARQLVKSGKYLMSTINNESRELNLHRIKEFGLKDIFTVFVSSCFVGFRKPEAAIYKLALDVVQQSPEECCFIDDRALNLECARQLGMHTIQMENVSQLRKELKSLGVAA
ncbi:MAG TPA: HAD family phosphatase [Terriglobales bacterium]|nr:HAD family phosphatase [Terriglobales bacterium]